MSTTPMPPPSAHDSRARGWAQVTGVIALLLAVAEGFRWGNRAYLAHVLAGEPGMAAFALERALGAQEALLHGVVLLAVGLVLVALGWRLVLVRR